MAARTETLHYELFLDTGVGRPRRREWATTQPLAVGDVLLAGDRQWLVDRVEQPPGQLPRAVAKPARYRLSLRHPDGRVELGVIRRLRVGGPRLGHSFSTLEDGEPASWQVVDERFARDEQGEPFLELVAERDFAELEAVPDHELEHRLAGGPERPFPSAYPPRPAGAMELVALPPGEEPDWDEAAAAIEALIIEEVGEDLLERCGVDPDEEPKERWLELVKQRLRSDLERFRDDVEGDHDQIEEWDVGGTRVLVSFGDWADEADPNKGHGWMCRLVDSDALGAAGFQRVRKVEL